MAKYSQLPLEVRNLIWEYFSAMHSPEIIAFDIHPDTESPDDIKLILATTVDEKAPLRIICTPSSAIPLDLAVHLGALHNLRSSKSKWLAIPAYPSPEAEQVVDHLFRFDKDTLVVNLAFTHHYLLHWPLPYYKPQLSDSGSVVQQLPTLAERERGHPSPTASVTRLILEMHKVRMKSIVDYRYCRLDDVPTPTLLENDAVKEISRIYASVWSRHSWRRCELI